jgi:hypothetical protein
MPSSKSKTRSSLLKSLEKIGKDSTAKRFKEALLKYRGDGEAAHALATGLYENANNWGPKISVKENILQDYYLDRGDFAKLPTIETAAANTNKEPSLKDIFAALQKIETRLDTLEQQSRDKARKPSL